MKGTTSLVAILVALLVLAQDASGHGINVVLERRGDLVVATCRYDGGIPVRDAEVVVQAPGGDGVFQTGRTDAQGRFAFVPAGAGEWQVMVDDGVGHRRTARIAIAPPENAAALASAEMPPNMGGAEEPMDEFATGGTPGEAEHAASPDRPLAAGAGDDTLPWRLATGLSLLLGVAGFAYGYTARARGPAGATR